MVNGTVRSLTDYGAFVDIGGVDALLHIGDISWSRVNKAADVLSEGQQIEAKVLKIDPEKRRVAIGMKQLLPRPWDAVAGRLKIGERIRGTVTRVTDFGAFVELEEGVEGLIHVSQLSNERVDKPSSLFKLGDVVEAEVTNVDSREKRIGLSIKALRKSEERDEMDAYMKRESGVRFSFGDLMSEAEKSKG